LENVGIELDGINVHKVYIFGDVVVNKVGEEGLGWIFRLLFAGFFLV
jgi:hypothetical protein